MIAELSFLILIFFASIASSSSGGGSTPSASPPLICNTDPTTNLSSSGSGRVVWASSSFQTMPHGSCYIVNNSSPKNYFIPAATNSEFSSFIANPPSGTSHSTCSSLSWSYSAWVSGGTCGVVTDTRTASCQRTQCTGGGTSTTTTVPSTDCTAISIVRDPLTQKVNRGVCAVPVNGICGSANGTSVSVAPSLPSELCSSGSATVISGSGPWTWTCNGSSGGSNSTLCIANTATTIACSDLNPNPLVKPIGWGTTSMPASGNISGTYTALATGPVNVSVSVSTLREDFATCSPVAVRIKDSSSAVVGSRSFPNVSWTNYTVNCADPGGSGYSGMPSTVSFNATAGQTYTVEFDYHKIISAAPQSNKWSFTNCAGAVPPPLSCPATTLNWTVAGNTCDAAVASTASASSVSLSDVSAPTTGSANFTCNAGAWSTPSGETCSAGGFGCTLLFPNSWGVAGWTCTTPAGPPINMSYGTTQLIGASSYTDPSSAINVALPGEAEQLYYCDAYAGLVLLDSHCGGIHTAACGTAVQAPASAIAPSVPTLCSFGTASAVTSNPTRWLWTCTAPYHIQSCSSPR